MMLCCSKRRCESTVTSSLTSSLPSSSSSSVHLKNSCHHHHRYTSLIIKQCSSCLMRETTAQIMPLSAQGTGGYHRVVRGGVEGGSAAPPIRQATRVGNPKPHQDMCIYIHIGISAYACFSDFRYTFICVYYKIMCVCSIYFIRIHEFICFYLHKCMYTMAKTSM